MKKNKANINYQDRSHQEGQQNNTAPEGQPNAHNNTRSVSEMKNESPEQMGQPKKQSQSQGGQVREQDRSRER